MKSFQSVAFASRCCLPLVGPNAVIPKIQNTPGDLWQALDMQLATQGRGRGYRCDGGGGEKARTASNCAQASLHNLAKNNNKYRSAAHTLTPSHTHLYTRTLSLTHTQSRCESNCLAYFTASIGNWQPLNLVLVARHLFARHGIGKALDKACQGLGKGRGRRREGAWRLPGS